LHHSLIDVLVAAYHHQAQRIKPFRSVVSTCPTNLPLPAYGCLHRSAPIAWIKALAVFSRYQVKFAPRAAVDLELGAPVCKHDRRTDVHIWLDSWLLESVISRWGVALPASLAHARASGGTTIKVRFSTSSGGVKMVASRPVSVFTWNVGTACRSEPAGVHPGKFHLPHSGKPALAACRMGRKPRRSRYRRAYPSLRTAGRVRRTASGHATDLRKEAARWDWTRYRALSRPGSRSIQTTATR